MGAPVQRSSGRVTAGIACDSKLKCDGWRAASFPCGRGSIIQFRSLFGRWASPFFLSQVSGMQRMNFEERILLMNICEANPKHDLQLSSVWDSAFLCVLYSPGHSPAPIITAWQLLPAAVARFDRAPLLRPAIVPLLDAPGSSLSSCCSFATGLKIVTRKIATLTIVTLLQTAHISLAQALQRLHLSHHILAGLRVV